MSLLAPANAVAGMMPGGGLLPTPNPLASVSFHINVDLRLVFPKIASHFYHREVILFSKHKTTQPMTGSFKCDHTPTDVQTFLFLDPERDVQPQ